MKCYIDAGNTRIKWQLGVKVQTHYQPWPTTARGLKTWAASLNAQRGGVIERFIIASVVPAERQAQLSQALESHYPDAAVQWVVSRARCCGVQIAYPDASQLGVDRFCALAAARQRYPKQNIILINAGTAVTVDYLRADGRHEGGLIMPSIAAITAGLNQLAPHLGVHWDKKPQMAAENATSHGLAVNTAGALQLGARWMQVSALTQIIAALSEDGVAQMAPQPVLLLSGGGADELQPLLDSRAVNVPDLVLEGVRLAARQAQPSIADSRAKKPVRDKAVAK